MNRQKRELVRKIAELDRALGRGLDPDGKGEQHIEALQDELARLSGFDSYIDYVMDPRAWAPAIEELPLC